MSIALLDYFLGCVVSPIRENKKIEKGKEINHNLSKDIASKVDKLKTLANQGNAIAQYQLGTMYLEAKEVGYNPELGRKYLEMAAKQKDFDANYALALFYKGHWSYQHHNARQSYGYYLNASACETDDTEYKEEVYRAIAEDFGKEVDKKKGLQVWFAVDIPIR